ncbi:MAG TPA: hypothetical protein VMI73_11250 [Trebonia sp.]|nr:hypothetical protein [Trebonia sp.]
MAIHVLAYLPRLPRLLSAEARGGAVSQAGGRPAPRAAQFLGGRGVRLSLLTVHLAGAWESPGKFFFH